MNSALAIEAKPAASIPEGGLVTLEISNGKIVQFQSLEVEVSAGSVKEQSSTGEGKIKISLPGKTIGPGKDSLICLWDTTGVQPGNYKATVTGTQNPSSQEIQTIEITVMSRPISRQDTLPVTLRRTASSETKDQALWVVIRNSTNQISFNEYKDFVDMVMCNAKDKRWAVLSPSDQCNNNVVGLKKEDRSLPFPNIEAYKLLKVASEVFLMRNCGVLIDFANIDISEESRRLGRTIGNGNLQTLWDNYRETINQGSNRYEVIPYLDLVYAKLHEIPIKDENADRCYGILVNKLTNPCFIELIWSYWHEEGMLVQTMNAISLRFQNKRRSIQNDPLANLEIDHLRPLNNMLWGHIQDEQHRLRLQRRAYEYDHHYGITLQGKAMSDFMPADSRSKFLEAFHNLLYLCSNFFKEDDDTTRYADGFPVLNGLKEVHLLLSQGAHNQYGDLPWTARQEMLMQQWLLARPEMRELLPTRIMVAHPEPWMGQVEAMNKLQGWTDTSVLHFRDLGVFGEQILLSIRYGAWTIVNVPDQAANWARYWRPEIQGYIHAYRAVTGIDLTAGTTDGRKAAELYVKPSVLLQRRLAAQRMRR